MPPTPPPNQTPSLIVPNGSDPTILTPDNKNTFAGLNIVPARELQQEAWCMLLYSHPGFGKTTLAGMFADYPPARNVLVIDAEGGATALSNKEHTDTAQVKSWAEITRSLAYLERAKPEDIPYKTIVWDNLSEMQSMHMATLTTGQPEIQHWGVNTAAILSFARRVRDLSRYKGINTVMIAWQDTEKNELESIIRRGVALTNKLAARLPGIVNIVGHLTVLNNPPLYTRHLSFAAGPGTDAKFRRAPKDSASPIPLDIYYGIDQNPIVDILSTLYEGKRFPTDKYTRPKGRQQAQANATAKPTDGDSNVTPTTVTSVEQG